MRHNLNHYQQLLASIEEATRSLRPHYEEAAKTSGSGTMFDQASLLITGGTGSLGNALTRYLLDHTNLRRVIIYSRDELKQHEMRQRFGNDPRLRFLSATYATWIGSGALLQGLITSFMRRRSSRSQPLNTTLLSASRPTFWVGRT